MSTNKHLGGEKSEAKQEGKEAKNTVTPNAWLGQETLGNPEMFQRSFYILYEKKILITAGLLPA